MTARVRALSAALSIAWCLVADSERPSHGAPPGDRIQRSPSARAVVVKTIHLSAPDQATVGVWSADGSRIAVGASIDKRMAVWEFPSGRRLPAPMDQPGGVSALAYSPDGRYLAIARGFVGARLHRSVVSLADAKTGAHVEDLIESDAGEIERIRVGDLAFSPDGRYLAVAYGSGVVLYELETGRGIRRVGRIAPGSDCVAFSPDSTHLAAARGLESSIHEVPTGRTVGVVGEGSASAIAFRPDGRQLALGNGPSVHLFVSPGWRQTAVWKADPSANVAAIRYTPDGQYLVIGVGRVVHVWNVETTARIATLTDHGARPISTVALSPNGRFAAAVGGGIVTIWELMP